jgi:flagellin-specific chaperone FliS
VETRVCELNHALTVVAHLQSVLDQQRGGDAAKQLERFYGVTRPMILEANVNPSAAAFRNLVILYTSLRQAWQEVEQKASAGTQESPAERIVTTAPITPLTANSTDSSADAPRGKWSA